MSIFQSNTCEIPHCSNETHGKKRCKYCEYRYDSEGNPFIVFCETQKFQRNKDTMFIWVMGGKVVHHNGYHIYHNGDPIDLIGMDAAKCADLLIEKDFELIYKNEAAWI